MADVVQTSHKVGDHHLISPNVHHSKVELWFDKKEPNYTSDVQYMQLDRVKVP